MVIRLIELINNFYRDEVSDSIDNQKAFGEFCCFGNYDAMNIIKCCNADFPHKDNWKITNEATLNRLDGTCDSRNILCYGENEKKDEEFWEASENSGFLFVTMIKLGNKKEEMMVYQRDLVDTINEEGSTIAYYSNSHCEIIAIKHTNRYREGMIHIHELQRKMKETNIQIVKMYTICAIRESTLPNADKVEEELVDCNLRAVIKKWDSLNEFLEKLKKDLQADNANGQCIINVFKTMGGSDILIELKDVSLSKLLTCYKMGELLTHSNKLYKCVFYNVESEILSKEWRM